MNARSLHSCKTGIPGRGSSLPALSLCEPAVRDLLDILGPLFSGSSDAPWQTEALRLLPYQM
jgi:hypothetical protein